MQTLFELTFHLVWASQGHPIEEHQFDSIADTRPGHRRIGIDTADRKLE